MLSSFKISNEKRLSISCTYLGPVVSLSMCAIIYFTYQEKIWCWNGGNFTFPFFNVAISRSYQVPCNCNFLCCLFYAKADTNRNKLSHRWFYLLRTTWTLSRGCWLLLIITACGIIILNRLSKHEKFLIIILVTLCRESFVSSIYRRPMPSWIWCVSVIY